MAMLYLWATLAAQPSPAGSAMLLPTRCATSSHGLSQKPWPSCAPGRGGSDQACASPKPKSWMGSWKPSTMTGGGDKAALGLPGAGLVARSGTLGICVQVWTETVLQGQPL